MSEGEAGGELRVRSEERKLENLEMWRVEIFLRPGKLGGALAPVLTEERQEVYALK